MIYSYDNSTPEQWAEFRSKLHSGEVIEVDESMYNYFLAVLPPIFMNRDVTDYPGHEGHAMRVDFGFAEGYEPIIYFTQSPDKARYHCVRSKRMNPYA